MNLPKTYNPKGVEDAIYTKWEKSGFFAPDTPRSTSYKLQATNYFSIAMPPPNATGELHLGHAVMLAIEDILTRYHRMKGDNTLWLPGTDHASIATQNKVEKLLADEHGVTRYELGRKKFLREVQGFVERSQQTIKNQVRKMGASCDWSRERYTLDAGLTKAVQMIFIKLYKDGLLYRGNRIVNWCPRCASTLADDEVEYKAVKGKFYYFRYGPIVIGTARPETKFLDKTIAVHPKDKRYKHLVGNTFTVPWIEGDVEAAVIADACVDMQIGSGAMTLTPAHSFIDFDLAQKYHLPIVAIIDEKGNLTDAAGSFSGMNAYKARKAIVEKMGKKGLVERIDEAYEHNLSVCYRCETPVEPLVSKQWFIDVNSKFKIPNSKFQKIVGKGKVSLKETANAVVRKGAIEIIPSRFNKTYFQWMENLRDWCISRQLWFGHRIPVWYCVGDDRCLLACKNPIVSVETPPACPHCGSKNLKQDPDVLDTWFSSGLWTFSTLLDQKLKEGESFKQWRKRSKDLQTFHPTSVLETGYDILFFWVARMIIMTTYALGEVPFKKVYLHGLVRDRQGRKMSKSLGNGIDPVEMIKKYGADAVRLSLVIGTTPGNDTRLYEEKIAGYRNFVNKVWNIARFVLLKAKQNGNPKHEIRNPKQIPNSKFQIPNFTLADHWILYELAQLVKRVNRDLERFRFSAAGEDIYEFLWHKFADVYIEQTKREKREHQQMLLEYTLEKCLIMLHPFIPFVTEYIWGKLKAQSSKLKATTRNSKFSNMLIVQTWVERLGFTVSKARALEFSNARDKGKQPALSEGEKKELKFYITSLEARLKNKEFLAKAPQAVIKKERERLEEANAKSGA